MKKAIMFSGQGSQKFGMGKDLYDKSPQSRKVFENANDIIGERFSDKIFSTTEDQLTDPRINQLAIFIYEMAIFLGQDEIQPDFVAGHSLGEYAALVAAGVLSMEDTISFLKIRGEVLYDAFVKNPSAMGVVIGISDEEVKKIISDISDENSHIYIANYNGPGQLVITGQMEVIKNACKIFRGMGAKRSFLLPQKGFGHSPNSIQEGKILAKELQKLKWNEPHIPIFQDVDGEKHTDQNEILENQIKLLTHPVLWTSIINNMAKEGVTEFYECGTDDTLQKIVSRMYPDFNVDTLWNTTRFKGIEPYILNIQNSH